MTSASTTVTPDDLWIHVLDVQARDIRIESETAVAREVVYESADDEDVDSEEEAAGYRRRRAVAPTSNKREFVIHLFGATAEGQSVRLDVEGFRPTLYLRLPDDTASRTRAAIEALRTYMTTQGIPLSQLTLKQVLRKKFYGFSANKDYPFLEITTPSLALWRNIKNLFLDESSRPATKKPLPTPYKSGESPEVYEANFDPMLRFFHVQKLNSCGWIKVAGGVSSVEDTDAIQWIAPVHYTEVLPASAPTPAPSAPFLEASWDIECYSATGDFPLPTKTWVEFATTLLTKKVSLQDALTAYTTLTRPKKIAEKLATAPFQTRLAVLTANGDPEELGIYLKKQIGEWVVLGDPVIQIGTTLSRNSVPFERHLFVFPDCDPIEGIVVHAFPTEREMIEGFFAWLVEVNPDTLMGYNVFGFDEKYLWKRAEELGCTSATGAVHGLSRLLDTGAEVKLEEKRLSSSALGDNFLYMWTTAGRLQVDMFQYIKRSASLPSYKLDEVTKHYLSGKLKKTKREYGAGGGAGAGAGACASTGAGDEKKDLLVLELSGAVKDLRAGRALCLLDETGDSLTDKMVIVEVRAPGVVAMAWPRLNDDEVDEEDLKDAVKWVVVKDDVGPHDIFRLHRGDAADRAIVGKYCLQDCDLVLELYRKLEVFNNSMSMANVCCVPISYIFTRGQGVKIESLMFRACRERDTLIPVLPAPRQPGTGGSEEDSYEGAIVLDPVPGFYSQSPVGVADFASLYPSTIESENISHDSLVWTKDFDYSGKLIGVVYDSGYDETKAATDNVAFTDIEFDIWRPDPADKRKHPEKKKCGLRICRYAQPLDGSKSTLPEIIRGLLAARKAKRVEGERETDPGRKALLDAEQLAYKLTANSLYGQLGSGTFKIRLQALAASTTAYGRKQILFAKAVIERFYGNEKDARCNAKVMYGDTDSLFVEFSPVDPTTGERITGRDGRQAVIDLTAEAGHLVTQALAPPHDFEFDKVFDPMLMFSKKRYAGCMFEENADDFVYKYMGIALKRRDNAPVVKAIFGKSMKKLLNERDIAGATTLVQQMSMDLVNGKTSLGQLTITKSLRADYADPTRIAHKALADRIAIRDPGNAPASGDRIPYVYIRPVVGAEAAKLQGDRIETPLYVREHKLTPDYEFYLEHQIQNPVSQMFGLLLEGMPGFRPDMLARAPTEPERLLVFRELVAAEILFKKAYEACRGDKKRAYVEKFFGVKAVAKPTMAPKAPSMRGSTPKSEGTGAGAGAAGITSRPTQATLSAFSVMSNHVRDGLLMDQMTKEKVKAKREATKREKEKAVAAEATGAGAGAKAAAVEEESKDEKMVVTLPTSGSLVADTQLMAAFAKKKKPRRKMAAATADADDNGET